MLKGPAMISSLRGKLWQIVSFLRAKFRKIIHLQRTFKWHFFLSWNNRKVKAFMRLWRNLFSDLGLYLRRKLLTTDESWTQQVPLPKLNYYNSFIWQMEIIWIEAVARRSSVKKVFLEISQNSQRNTCARVSF